MIVSKEMAEGRIFKQASLSSGKSNLKKFNGQFTVTIYYEIVFKVW